MSLKFLASPWMAALLLQAALSWVLLIKRMWQRFPMFLAYCVAGLILNACLFGIYLVQWGSYLYFKAYWFTEATGLLLGLAVVYEIFKHLLSPYPALRKLAIQSLQAAVVLLMLVGCIVAYSQSSAEQSPLISGLLVIEQGTRILEVGLLGFLFVFASAFGLHWRQYIFGIAVGLGIFAAVELVAVTMRVQFGVAANPIFNIVRSVSFNTSLLIWIGYILAPELASAPAQVPKRAQLEQWNRAVMELIYQ